MIIKMEKNKTYINITMAVECVLSMKRVDKDERVGIWDDSEKPPETQDFVWYAFFISSSYLGLIRPDKYKT